MRSITYIGAALATLALGLGAAACGGGGEEPAAAAGQTDEQKLRDAQVKFAQCMRENGVEQFPDPGANGESRIAIGPESGIDPEEFEAASKKCEQFREDIRPQLTEADQEKFKEQALAHSRCMREHGIDFPDPEFSGDGKVTMKLERGRVDPEDPDFKAAEKACGGGIGGGVGIKSGQP